MKILVAIASFMIAEVTLSKDTTDWNSLATNLIGSWQGPEITPGATFRNSKPIPTRDSVLVIRADGTALVTNFFGEEDKKAMEFNYIFNEDVIVFYEPSDRELSKAVRFRYRIADSFLELDYLGGATVKSRLKKMVEQDGTGQPATRPESNPEGSDKPQPEAEGRSR